MFVSCADYDESFLPRGYATTPQPWYKHGNNEPCSSTALYVNIDPQRSKHITRIRGEVLLLVFDNDIQRKNRKKTKQVTCPVELDKPRIHISPLKKSKNVRQAPSPLTAVLVAPTSGQGFAPEQQICGRIPVVPELSRRA